jgi:hypothetical protein
MRTASLAATAALTLALPVLSGCLIYGSSESFESGTRIGQHGATRIVPGETTQEWVRTVFGEPNRKTVNPNGRELWVYNYYRRSESGGALLFVIGGKSDDETRETSYIEFENGVVAEFWRE